MMIMLLKRQEKVLKSNEDEKNFFLFLMIRKDVQNFVSTAQNVTRQPAINQPTQYHFSPSAVQLLYQF